MSVSLVKMNGCNKEEVVHTNYFSCTLGEAASIKEKHPTDFRTVGNLIELQALNHPEEYAVGFPDPNTAGEEWGSNLYSKKACMLFTNFSQPNCLQLSEIWSEDLE